MKRLFLWLGVGTLIWLGCEKQTGTGTTVIDSPDLQLAAVDAGCTDVLLKITAGHQRYSGPLLLLQNDEPVDTLNYGGADTLMWRQNLAINAAYHWRIRWQDDRDKYAETQATTLDTTRYDFSWETFEFGFGRSSSHLADVAIINENNIWAVGEIHTEDTYTYDSLGNWIQPYNAVHWDGNTWELKRIPFQTFCGQPGTSIYPISTLIAFSKNNIYFTSSSRLTHWNGDTFKVLDCIPVSVNKFWGLSPDDFFAVGAIGKIAHYDGSEWRRIESGTDLDITDIWGGTDPLTGKTVVLCTSAEKGGQSENKLFAIDNNLNLNEIPWILEERDPYSAWFKSYVQIYFCGGGVIVRNYLGEYYLIEETPQYYTNQIRGSNYNNIFVVGDFGTIAHYNGTTWYDFGYFTGGVWYGLAVKENIAVAVGVLDRKGIVAMIRRN
jgi:hypothetical protein